MKNILPPLALVLCLAMSGCGLFGGDSGSTDPVMEADQSAETPQAEPAAAEPAAKTDKKASSNLKGEARIRADLQVTGEQLVGRAARTVMPSKASRSVRKVGKEYVANYIEVDQSNVSTDMRPGSKGQYVGFIRYSEYEYECRAATRKEALSTNQCERIRTRNLNELIRYDGKKWLF
ncbi:translation initiation factor 2 [uncultured Desulfovibrio sp.]|uniref:translation initiation factor 2 n=1 Tax=uncultured Desulfovibrio sp. TaxID=167968 RepID=UPI0026274077|nr:translation initiation factor 2 [uncultured Desulfovibrio sp.]